jgi:WD40 repeat protein/uncharacterized caspase-like protein
MKRLSGTRSLSILIIVILISSVIGSARSPTQETKPKDDRGLNVKPANSSPDIASQNKSGGGRPEIVLQAGITSPQSQICFSRDGRLLASMGINGNAIKLWDVASGHLLRQLDSSSPSLGVSSYTRPFRFSPDGRTLIAMADARVRRWEVETGRELNSTPLSTAVGLMGTAMSDDGAVLAATSLQHDALKLWDTVSGRAMTPLSLGDHEQTVAQDSFAVSPDGKLAAALTETVDASRGKGMGINATVTRQIVFWEIANAKRTKSLKISTAPVQYGVRNDFRTGIAFSSDGMSIALRDESTVKIFDVASGREVKTLNAPRISGGSADETILLVAGKFLFSPDRRLISLITENSRVAVVDATSSSTAYTIAGHTGPVIAMAFSADGKLLATSGIDNRIKLWDAATGNEVQSLSGAAMPISDIAFAADGKSLTIGSTPAISRWELNTGGVQRGLILPDDYSHPRQDGRLERSGLLSADGKLVIAGNDKQPIAKIWEADTGKEVSSVNLSPGKELGKVAFSENGSTIALIEKNRRKGTGPQVGSPSTQAPPNIPAAIPMPDMSKIMEQMRKDPKKMQEQMKKAQEAMNKGDFSAGMAVLESIGMSPASSASPNRNTNLRLIDSSNGRPLQELPVPGGFFNEVSADTAVASSAISFSPDGKTFASCVGMTAPISLRDVATGQELKSLRAANSVSVSSLSWSADAQKLASAHWSMKRGFNPTAADNFSLEDLTFTIKIWDPKTGTELRTLSGHQNFINRLAFSRDSRFLASGGTDSLIKIWDLTTGQELRTLKGHSGPITALSFSPDSRFLVSGSDDGSSRMWNPQTGDLVATLVTMNKGDDWLVVTPDGLFDGSPGGWNQILWRFSQNVYDVSPVEIFFNEYFRPGLLPDLVAGKKVAAAIDISQRDRRQPRLKVETTDGQVTNITARTLKVRITVTDAPAGAQDVRLFRNGSLVKVWRGDVMKGQSTAQLETTVSAVAGSNLLTAYAFNRDNVKSVDATLAINGADSLKRPATLHILAIGVNEYANQAYNLKYAAADGRAFAEEVERQQKKLNMFAQIEVTPLFDKDATKANIIYAIRKLAGSSDAKSPAGAPETLGKIKAAEPEDAVVVFYAGHGTAQDQRFYLIPHDLGYAGSRTELDEAGLKTILAHSVSDLELEQACEGIDAGHLLMVIDACNSGQALEAEEKRRGPMNSKGLAQLAYEKGMYILTAAQSYQAAMEAEQLGHGYLTYALVEEGLKSALADDEPKDGQVVLREWLDYATDRVPKMQEAKIKEGRGLKHAVSFVEGEEKVDDDKRSVQRPRVFYRREVESQPMVVAKP